jgi:hypothetical protein
MPIASTPTILFLQNESDQPAENQEHQHPDQKDAGRCQFDRVGVARHWLNIFGFRFFRGFMVTRLQRDARKTAIMPQSR